MRFVLVTCWVNMAGWFADAPSDHANGSERGDDEDASDEGDKEEVDEGNGAQDEDM